MNTILAIIAILWLFAACFFLGYLFAKIHTWGEGVMAEQDGPERDAAGTAPCSTLPSPCSTLPAPCYFPAETHAETLLVTENDSRAKQPSELDTQPAQIQQPTPSATLR